MARTAAGAGRMLWVVCLGGVALLCGVALAIHVATPFEVDAAALALGAVLIALAGLVAVQREVGRTRQRQEKVSEELDLLAQTLLRIETGLAALDGSGTKAKSTLNDVAGDVHSLSEVVKSLAEAVAAQHREIGALKPRGEASFGYRPGFNLDLRENAPLSAPSLVPSFLPPARVAAAAALAEYLPVSKAPLQSRPDGNGAIIAAAAAGEIDLHAQPVVTLPQRRERLFDIYPLLRVGDDALLPARYTSVLEGAGVLPDLELGLVGRALVFAHRLATAGSDARVCIALSRTSLSDGRFLRRLDALVEDHEAASRRLVIEIEQQAWTDVVVDSDAFGRIRRGGVGFGLRAITDENLNPPALARLGIRHVRIEMTRLLEAIDSDGAHADVVTLVGALARSGIEVIADRVEDEVVVPELIDIGVPLAQGLAFALPCPVETILERPPRPAASPKAPPGPEAPKPDGSGPPQGSLRDFLRRAG